MGKSHRRYHWHYLLLSQTVRNGLIRFLELYISELGGYFCYNLVLSLVEDTPLKVYFFIHVLSVSFIFIVFEHIFSINSIDTIMCLTSLQQPPHVTFKTTAQIVCVIYWSIHICICLFFFCESRSKV